MSADSPVPAGRANLLFALLFAATAAVLCIQLTEAFVGKHEGWNAAVYSTAARNHLAYGLGATRLGVILNGDTVSPAAFLYYTNHPPLLPLALAASFAVFGPHEWAARLVPILFTLASLVLVWRIGARLRGETYGLLAAAIFAFVPMNAFYGRMVDHEALTLTFALAALYAYLRWREAAAPGWFAASLAMLALAMATGWPGYYLAGFLPAHHLLADRGTRRDRRVLLYPLLAFASFGVFLLHVAWLRGGGGLGELASQFVTRTSAHTADFTEGAAHRFTWPGFAVLWAARAYKLFTLPVLAAALFELWDTARGRGGPPGRARGVTLLLAAFGVTHLLLFRQGAWVHDYWGFYLAVPLAMLAAGGVLGLARGPASRVIALFLLLFLGAAAPRVRAMHAADDDRVVAFSGIVAGHARPGELVSTNDGFVKPQVVWYARRDPIETPLWTPAALADTLRSRSPRAVAFFLLDGEPESAALEAWLTPRFPSETDSVGGRRYRIFHVPAGTR
jgi:4-amino-4-deoxy-L-arabinose transferase-like glycosyltransferase